MAAGEARISLLTGHANADFDTVGAIVALAALICPFCSSKNDSSSHVSIESQGESDRTSPLLYVLWPGTTRQKVEKYVQDKALPLLEASHVHNGRSYLKAVKNWDVNLMPCVSLLCCVDTRKVQRLKHVPTALLDRRKTSYENESDVPLQMIVFDHHPASTDDVAECEEGYFYARDFQRQALKEALSGALSEPFRDLLVAEPEIGSASALVTLFLAATRGDDLSLSAGEATLIALGIYDDTGCLTYESASAADFRAVAVVADAARAGGGVLDMSLLRDFVYDASSAATQGGEDAMSSADVSLIEQLKGGAQQLSVRTSTSLGTLTAICICTSDSEPKSFAKLVEIVLETGISGSKVDVVFGIGSFSERVVVVGRSRSEKCGIDVGAICATVFGNGNGGGHACAASAASKAHTAEEASSRIASSLAALAPANEPGSSMRLVADIMSRPACVVSLHDSLEEAHRKFADAGVKQIVVTDGDSSAVAGILDSLAAESVLAQAADTDSKPLPLTVAGVLPRADTKGQVRVVRESEPLSAALNIIESGIQRLVPVVNASGNEVLGVVTRTNIIEFLRNAEESRRFASIRRVNIKGPLTQMLIDSGGSKVGKPAAEMLKRVGALAQELGNDYAAYLVGGAVRSALLRSRAVLHDVRHFDVFFTSSSGDVSPESVKQFARLLASQCGDKSETACSFEDPWWTVSLPPGFSSSRASANVHFKVRVMAPRIDVYRGSRSTSTLEKHFVQDSAEQMGSPPIPGVGLTPLKAELFRRNFSIDACAIVLGSRKDRFGTLVDFFGGQADAENRLLRPLHSHVFSLDFAQVLYAGALATECDLSFDADSLRLLRGLVPLSREPVTALPKLRSGLSRGVRWLADLHLKREAYGCSALVVAKALGFVGDHVNLKALHYALGADQSWRERLTELLHLTVVLASPDTPALASMEWTAMFILSMSMTCAEKDMLELLSIFFSEEEAASVRQKHFKAKKLATAMKRFIGKRLETDFVESLYAEEAFVVFIASVYAAAWNALARYMTTVPTATPTLAGPGDEHSS